MKLFRILFAFDALAFLVLVCFFADGLRYSSGGDYFGAWAPLLAVPALALLGAWALKSKAVSASFTGFRQGTLFHI
jgi:hypothetical protein